MQNGQDTPDTQVWGQIVGSGYPELTDSAEKKVYKVTFFTESNNEYAAKYANHNGKVELPEDPEVEGMAFDHWSTVKDVTGGEKFDNTTLVTEDILVYAVGRKTFGSESDEIALTTTYGTALTEDLSRHVKYESGDPATGKFTYAITANDNSLSAFIEGDNLKIPADAKAGIYTLTITATEKSPEYSLMSIGTYGTEPVMLKVKVTVEKANPIVTPPSPKALTYTGAAQELVTAGNTTGGTMQYSLDQNSDYSTDIPKGTDAATYTVWYKVVGDKNHNDTDPVSLTITIGKGETNITASSVTYTYGTPGGITLTATVAPAAANGISLMKAEENQVVFAFPKGGKTETRTVPAGGGTVTVNISADKVKEYLEPGENDVTVSYGGSGNLEPKDSVTMQVMVEKKTVVFSFLAYDKPYDGTTKINGTFPNPPLGVVSGDDVSVGTYTARTEDANAGESKTVIVAITGLKGADAEYYAGTTGTTTVTIYKAPISDVHTITPNDLTYNGEPQELVTAPTKPTEGTMMYALDENGEFKDSIPQAKNAGTYYVWYYVKGDDNHNDSVKDKVPVTIKQKSVKLTWTGYESLIYTGKPVNVTANTTDFVEADTADGGVVIKFSGNTETDAGEHSATATLGGSRADNYKLINNTQTYTIGKATANVIVPVVSDTYGSNYIIFAHVTAKDVAPSLVTGTVQFTDGDITLGTAKVTNGTANIIITGFDRDKQHALFGTNGRSTVTATYNGNDNINDVSGNGTATISPRTIEYNVTATGRVYEPGNTEVDVTLTPTNLVEGDDVTLTAKGNLSSADPNTYESVSLTEITMGGADAKYYEVGAIADNVPLTSPVTISQIKAVVETPPTGKEGLTYTGDVLGLLTSKGTSNGGTMQYYVGDKDSTEQPDVTADWKEDISDITATDAGTYTIWYRANGNIDYATSDLGSFTVTISKATSTVTVQAATGTYGEGIAVTAEVTVPDVDENLVSGTIEFKVGGQSLGTANVENGTATLTVSGTDRGKQHALFGTAGSSTVTAVYAGNDNIEDRSSNSTATIGQRDLQYTVTAEDKTFDGKTDVSVTLKPSNALPGDQVYLTATGAVESPAAGTYNTVNLADITLSGEDSRYYTVETEKTGVELSSPVNITEETSSALQGQVTVGGRPVADATVTLKQGGKTVATTTTGADGTYSFETAAPGVYDVVVEANGKTMTSMVTVTDETGVKQDLTMPEENVSSVLDTQKASDSVVAVGGLDEVANAQTSDAGSSVTVTMTVESETASSAPHAWEIQAAAGNWYLDYLEIGLKKTTTATGGASTTEPLTETTSPLTVVLRFDFTGKSNVVVYRYHSGAVDTLTETNNSNGEYIVLDETGGTITLHVKNFSTYAIGYTLAGETPTPPAPPSTSGSTGNPSYGITIPSSSKAEGGVVTANRTSAQQGSKITLTVKPDEGYHFGSLTVNDRNGKPVELTDNGDGTYTFTMPYGQVTVNAVFVKCGSLNFTDLNTTAWYHGYTDYVLANGLMHGKGNNRFAPEGTVTRAEMVTTLWNLRGKPVVNYYMTYSDVNEESWYSEAVRWASSEGIAQGYGNGKFGPNDAITREQMAVMLYRYEQKYGSGGFTGAWMYLMPFDDLESISDWAFEAVAWCNMRGVIEGKSGNIFDPKGLTRRSELAAVLTRYRTEKNT